MELHRPPVPLDPATRTQIRGGFSIGKRARTPTLRYWLAALLVFLAPTTHFAQTSEPRVEGVPVTSEVGAQPGAATVETWLYAVDRGSSDGSGTLYRLGTTASGGSVGVQLIGETGVEDIFDIAFMGDRLIGVAPGGATFGTSDNVLIEIDPATGATTAIASIDPAGDFNALVGETPSTVVGATSQGEVWRIDIDALRAWRLGTFGSGRDSSGDLAISPDGTVYGTVAGSSSDELATVDLTNGRATILGSIGFRNVYGLAFRPGSGFLLGLADARQNPRLVSLNTANGAATVIGAIPIAEEITGLATAPQAAAACNAGADAVFLQNGRFRIDACWRTADGNSGTAKLAQQAGIGATLWFFNPGNPELFLKVVNACAPPFDRFWVFLAGLTNVEVEVTFTDTEAGVSRHFVNPQGQPMQSVIDTTSFATCP